MKFYKKNKNWLRHRVKSHIREKHKELFQSFWKTCYYNLKEYTFDRKRWWLILSGIITVFIVGGLLNINFLNILNISIDTAKIIVDQRTANIATTISITLVVVGFLISNLALKEAFAYRLLFKHSYLYPIIYLTLSTIGCFFIVSMIRDELDPNRFINLVITGTYLTIVILILIGFLFKTIIQFTNDKVIKQLLHQELMIEATRSLKSNLLKRYSSELYNNSMLKYGAKEYNWAESLNATYTKLAAKQLSNKSIKIIKPKEKLIYDINLNKIEKFISNKTKNSKAIYFKDLSIDKVTSDYENYIWEKDNQNTKKEKEILRNNIILKKVNDIKRDKESVRKYFDQKLEELINKSEYKNLGDLLQSYCDLFELQMKHKQ